MISSLKGRKHIFFDLDHTIWDFDKNAEETLYELYQTYNLKNLGISSVDEFIEKYTINNHALWADYHLGNISKETLRGTRFNKTFVDLNISPELIPSSFENDYVKICPTKTNLFPNAHKTLTYLKDYYSLHIITNGFKESTEIKVFKTDILNYFENIFISETIGFNKPDYKIFEHVLNVANAKNNECVMIGDSIEADIRGAKNAGMDAIYFNPTNKDIPKDIEWAINDLEELISIF